MASVTIHLVALLPPPAACRAWSRLYYCNWTSALTGLSYSLDHIHAVNKSCFGVSLTWVDPGSGKVGGGLMQLLVGSDILSQTTGNRKEASGKALPGGFVYRTQ